MMLYSRPAAWADLKRTPAGGRRVAFIHPKATSGILLELTE